MAAQRKKIGLFFVSADIGVVYYITNILKTIGFLPDCEKPEIIVFFSRECKPFLPLLQYPGIKTVEVNINSNNRTYLYFASLFSRKNLFYDYLLKMHQVDGIFPFNDFPVQANNKTLLVSWIPDFQHKFYPHFFTKKNLFLRERRFKSIIKGANVIVLSSYNSLEHINQFYKIPEKTSIKVLRFVSMIRDHIITPFGNIKERYHIALPFFLVSNQFYEHKNHIAVLKAIKILKMEGLKFEVIFSGKTEDYRNPDFYPSLIEFIKANGLESNLKILGLIPREDQLSMLANSLAVIQPSRFEGWSTIIEDAKTLRHQVICSSIKVHVEQMGEYGFYFDMDSPEDLAKQMRLFLNGSIEKKVLPDDYEERARTLARSFSEIFSKE